jgi:arylformamidase
MLFDISVPLQAGDAGFPGDPPTELAAASSAESFYALTRLACSSHAGTHLDGAGHVGLWGPRLDHLSLDRLIGSVQVVDCCQVAGHIGAADLRLLPLQDCRRLLLKTRNSRLWQQGGFCSDYQALTLDGAHFLCDAGTELIGIDYLSIEAFDGDGEVHHRLLRDGVAILEGLDLSAVAPGSYELICLPLKLACADGAPCRAVLRAL